MHVIRLKRVLSAFFSAVFAEMNLLSSEQADYMDKTYIMEILGEKNYSEAVLQKNTKNHKETSHSP